MSNTSAIISKVWSYAHVLRDAGVGYGDYLEQLTYLLFLKMADEYSKPPYDRKLKCYSPENRHVRKETWSQDNLNGRWRKFSYKEIVLRDKTNLDISWVKDESLADLDNLPDPDVLANEIIENVEAGLEG